MERKLSAKEYLVLGSMLFGMFFGAGNLIFPVIMGQLATENVWPAIVGFCITGVGLPVLGVAALGISRSGSLFEMSTMVSRGFAYFFTIALYLTIGPFFAIPRNATTSFSIGINPFIPKGADTAGLLIFSFLFFVVALLFSLKPSGIMTWIGKLLNPIFLILLAILLVAVVVSPMGHINSAPSVEPYDKMSFFQGFLEGYNTMDALASLCFGIVLIDAIRRLGVKKPKQISFSIMKAGLFTLVLMTIIYAALAVAGAESRNRFDVAEDGGAALNMITDYYFHKAGAVLLGGIVTFACLKTTIALITSCGEAFRNMFPNFVSYNTYAVSFSIFSFAVSNVGLANIISYAVPVLMFLYPITIVIIGLSLAGNLFGYDKSIYRWTMAFTMLAAIFDFLKTLPDLFQPHIQGIVSLGAKLPFSELGMGWIVPALIGLAIGFVFHIVKPQPQTRTEKADENELEEGNEA